jgi:quaternary ammonium compound-resistance protein SugE
MAAVAWIFLVIAGLLEVVWALSLKEADGFSKPGWAITGLVVAMFSLALLTAALRDLPAGTAYAAWTGIGAVGVVLFGMLLLGEEATVARLGFVALIIAGVVGLRIVEG